MSVITRYIMLEVIKGSLVAVLVLLSLLTFFTFADELGDLGQGDYGLKEIARYLLLGVPQGCYDLMPSAALLGGIIILGNMANSRELVAMQAAGISRSRIITAVLLAGSVLGAISGVIGEYIAPASERASHLLKTSALKEQIASQTRYGFWVRDGNIYINIRRVANHEELGDISIYELDERRNLKVASHAYRALYQGGGWRLEGIRDTRLADDGIRSDKRESEEWSSILAPDLLNVFVFRPENLSAGELNRYIHYLDDNGQDAQSARIALWERIVNPFMILTMLTVALPLVLGVGREAGFGQRVVLGVTIGLGFYLINQMFGHFGLIYRMNPVFATTFPTVVVLTAAVAALARANR
ncbi:MAG: LPS export ABC transporter permease LptG [Methylococcaceae bacterium]|nr:LPS export ABC transporter permease LptG [Methylococcaceae bacterium]